MIGLPNPYVLIGGGVAVLAVASSMYIQSTLIHKYHALYDCAESALNCPKGAESIPHLQTLIGQMTTAQNTQMGKSEGNVIRVIQGPKEITQIIKEIQAAPSKPCQVPVYTEEVKNAF